MKEENQTDLMEYYEDFGRDKTESRVSKFYKKGTKDWVAQYDMLLPDGITCNDCIHRNRCITLFAQEERNTSCQFYPNRFKKIEN